MADKKQNAVKYGEVISKCWEDEAYRKRFIETPEDVLTEAGYVVEEGVTYKVIEQPKLVKYIVIPHEGAKDAVQAVAKGLLNEAEKKEVLIPESAEIRMIQNSEDTRYLVLPASPKSLTQHELSLAAGGDGNQAAELNIIVLGKIVQTEVQTVVTVGPTVEPTVAVVATGVAVLV